MWTQQHKQQTGFTIVELLIVIVVIAILAAIVIVAYSGIQDKARYSAMQQDLSSLNKAIQLYYVDNGSYPFSGATGGNVIGTTLNIPGLIPTYIAKSPTMPNDGLGGYYAYIWSTNGTNYKLVRLIPGGGIVLPAVEQSNPNPDTARPGRGWGYWSPGGSAL